MHLLIPAAGKGSRMGASHNKLLLQLASKPLLAWTLLAADAAKEIDWMSIIGQPYDWPNFQKIIAGLNLSKPVEFIQGGATRQASVYNGLQGLPSSARRVLIHDGARCLATPQLFDRCAKALVTAEGLIAAVPVKDTIKIVQGDLVEQTPSRAKLWAAQTPQGFDVKLLKRCHQQGRELGWEVTDDAALFEQCGLPVKIVMGEETNLKITTPVDLALAEFILAQRKT